MPNAIPRGIAAVAVEFESEKRKPARGNAQFESKVIPKRRSAATASGRSPSPQGLSIGGRRASATVTRNPFRLAAIAVAIPAGPPPTTKTSAPIAPHFPRPLPPQQHQLRTKAGAHG